MEVRTLFEMVKLTNGKRVGNFSSPHDFEFEDGTILKAVSKEEAQALSIRFHEDEDENGDVRLSFELTANVLFRMKEWMDLWQNGMVNVVFVPLPMLTALKEYNDNGGSTYDIKNSPFRCIRMVDRINKKVSISKQCL